MIKEMNVGEIIEKISSLKKVPKSKYLKKGLFPIIDQSEKFISGYTNDVIYTYNGKLPITIFGDHTRRMKFINFKFCCGADGTHVLIPKSFIDPTYFYYSLKALKLKNYGYERHFKYLKEEKIRVLDMDFQKKIASVLSTYDKLIENNTRRIEILEEMAQRIYKEWFVDFKYPGHENDKLVDSELGMIPEDWEVKKLEEICLKVTDGTHSAVKPTEEGYHMVSGKDLLDGFVDFSKTHYISKEDHDKIMERSKPEKGDILFSKIGTIGNLAIVNEEYEFSIKNVALFKPADSCFSKFLYGWFSNKTNIKELSAKASGTSQKFFSLAFLKKLDLIVPNIKLLNKYQNFIDPIFKQRYNLYLKNQLICKTRDYLLPKLISGKVDITDLDIDTSILDE